MRTAKLTSTFQQALADAQSMALSRDHSVIEPAHLLKAMLEQSSSSVASLLHQAGCMVGQLK
ncbi:MAG: ATP-dependent Clp protease ATP-binding subunit ClpB, partial [Pseudoalteromonas tetraodonis]